MTANRQLRVFLCHSSNDKPAVRDLYDKLTARGIDAWLDEKKLLPGQDWDIEIQKAVRGADTVIICLSKTSITKEGYVQKEIKFSLDIALEKPEGTIYLIPTRLEDCKVPDSLIKWHWVNLFEPQGFISLFKSLGKRADSLGLQPKPTIADWEERNKIILSNGMEFMRIPAGKFLMGSEKYSNEKPQHTVDIPYDYWMARFPVTNEQYNLYVKAKGIYHPVSDWEKKNNHPLVNVSWNTVMEYCQWLNDLLKEELPAGLILRLPTEAEWEKAARGTDGREYPWGNTFDKNKCYSMEWGKGETTSVGSYSPQGDSPYGCVDMAGNVSEWTHSKNNAYPYNANDDREDEQKSAHRVNRGGCFGSAVWNVCCASRSWADSNLSFTSLGFRIMVSPLHS
jgi:formylglycine-generating enzyme required for sulfatase activity